MKWVLSALGLVALFSLPTAFAGDCVTSFDQDCIGHAYSEKETAADHQFERERVEARKADPLRQWESEAAREAQKAEKMNACLVTAEWNHEGRWAERCLSVAESARAELRGCTSAACKEAERNINDNRNCSLSREDAAFLDRRYEDAKDDCFQLFR